MNGQFALIIDKRGDSLEMGSHDTVVVRHADGSMERVGMRALASVVLHGDVRLTTGLLQQLAMHGVALTAMPMRGRHADVGFTHWPHTHVMLRHGQHLAYANRAARMQLARLVVAAKCESMASFAHDLNAELDHAAFRSMHAATQASDLSSLMGVEGACSRRHFDLLRQAYSKHGLYIFEGRTRNPPLDPPNALMSLAYTMASARAAQIALQAGLDIQLGFLHGLQRNRPSLVLDIIEPARAVIDAWVFALLTRKAMLTPEMFSESSAEGVRLTQTGRGLFYPAWFSEGCVRAEVAMRGMIATIVAGLRAYLEQVCLAEEVVT